MKKAISASVVSIALASCFALGACSSESADSTAPQDAAQPAAESQQAEEAPAKYQATIDGAATAVDYQGAPAVVVTYSWTNNSDEAMSAAAALSMKCFQNGVQLDVGIVTEDIDSTGYTSEVKPGAGTTFQMAYLLDDESDVTVEVSELISLSDALLAEDTFSVA